MIAPLTADQQQLISRTIEKFGRETQCNMVIEECSELIAELSRHKRIRFNHVEVISEIADVFIVINQAALMFGISDVNAIVKEKMLRLDRFINHNSDGDKIGET